MELMIVIFGGLYFFIRIMYEEIISDHGMKKLTLGKETHRRLELLLTNDEVERTVRCFLTSNIENVDAVSEYIGDNLEAIYETKDYRNRYIGSTYYESIRFLILTLIMSKGGYVPKQFYNGITYTRNTSRYYILTPEGKEQKTVFELMRRYLSQIQKNLDEAGTGEKIVFYFDDSRRSLLHIRWKHEHVTSFWHSVKISLRYKK